MTADADQLLGMLHESLIRQFPFPVETGAGSSILLFATVGRPVDPRTFQPPSGIPPAAASQWIQLVTSQLVDPLPGPGASFLQTTHRLSDEYDGLISAASPTENAPPDVQGVAAQRIAAARRRRDNCWARPIAGPAVPYLPTAAQPADWYDPAGPQWASLTVSDRTAPGPGEPPPESPPPIQLPALTWQVLPPTTPTINLWTEKRAELLQAQGPEQLSKVQLQHVIEPGTVGDSQVSGDSPAADAPMAQEMVTAAPDATARSDIAADAQTEPFAIREQALVSDLSASNLLAAQPVETLTALVDESQPVAPTSSGYNLTLSYCAVTLDRQWLDSVLLESPGWHVPGFAPGRYSVSDILQPGQIVPAIPTGFIVVKDVLIKANWSDADAAHASSAASFGPFINIESHFDTGSGTYVIKGMQILAWLCEVPPFLPPGNDISIPTPPASVPS